MRELQTRIPDEPVHVDAGADLKIAPWQAAVELACMVVVVELIEWVVPLLPNSATAYGRLALAIALLMAACYLRDGLRPTQLGIRIDNFIPALGDLLPFLSV